MLNENLRNQLDNIVLKMVKNKETDENIQWVVNDYIHKFDSDTRGEGLKQQLKQEKQNAQNINSFLNKSAVGQIFTPQFAKEIPQAAGETLLKNPAKFIASTIETPETFIKGKALQQEYNLPLIGKFKSFQSEAEDRANRIIEGQDPLYYALAPFAQVPLAAFETTGLINQSLKTGSKIIKATGKKIFQTGFNLSAKEAHLVQSYKAEVPFFERLKLSLQGEESKLKPITMSETALRQKGILGTKTGIGIRAKRASQKIWQKIVEPSLNSIKEKINLPSFFKEAEKQIIEETPELARRNDLLTALNSLKEDYKKIFNVSYSELQKFKEGWAKFIPEKAYRGKPITGAFNDVKDFLSDLARQKIYQKTGNHIKLAYLDYGNLKNLSEMGQVAMRESGFKGGFGSFISSLYDVAAIPTKTIGGKVIYKIGQGFEFISEAGAKNLGEIFKIMK